MSVINRYIRVTILILLSASVGIFALKAYARTLDSVPPVLMQTYAARGSERIVVDLQRNQQLLLRNNPANIIPSASSNFTTPPTSYNVIRADRDAGYILYKPSDSNGNFDSSPFSELEILDVATDEVRTIDLSHLPSQVSSNTYESVVWSDARSRYILSLMGGGIASLTLPDGNTKMLHPELRLKGRISPDGEWVIGILEDGRQARLLAYHLDTGEEITILEDKQPYVMAYDALWSYTDNLALVFHIDRLVRGITRYDIPVIALDVDTGNILHNGTLVIPSTEQPYLSWYGQWFDFRYGDEFGQN